MKKLVIVNHLGEIVREVDVFLEGQDTELTWPTPTAIWLGRIIICDPNQRDTFVESEPLTLVIEVEPEPEPAQDIEPGEMVDEDESEQIFEKGEPDNDLEAASNKGTGIEGAGEAGQSPSAKEPSEKPARGKVAKRSKRVRDTKTA